MPTYKFYYFPARGAGEPCRLVFHLAGVEFEDIRLNREEWLQHKPSSPSGQMPYLDVDNGNVRMPQSLAIAKYLARLYGFDGKSDFEKYLVDMFIDFYIDVRQALFKFSFEKDEAVKAEKKEEFLKQTLPNGLKNIDKFFTENNNGQGFLVGNSVTLADLYAINLNEFIRGYGDVFKDFPKLAAHDERVRAVPKLTEYLKERPVTEF